MHRNHRGGFYNFFKGEIFVAKAIVLTEFLLELLTGIFFFFPLSNFLWANFLLSNFLWANFLLSNFLGKAKL